MKNKYVFVVVMLLSILVVSFGFTNIYVSQNEAQEDDDFVVVTSFYPMYIASMNVIGDTEGVALKNLSEPQTGCLHDFQLTPADMKLLSTADVFIINGGGIESFMEEIAAQYPSLTIIEACDGISLLSADDVNAHAWMSVELYRKQVENIASGLSQADKQHEANYLANAAVYDGKLAELSSEQEELISLASGEEVIVFHCGFDYLAKEYGMEVVYCMDLDEERQTSAGEVAAVVEAIKEHNVKYIFAEELYGADMCQTVRKEADVTVVYLDALNRGEYDADSYLEGMKNNLKLIYQALNEE